MIGKVVKIKDPGLVPFFYPSFAVKTDLYLADKGTEFIYVGKSRPKILEFLGTFSPKFISLVGVPTLDLSTRWALIEWIKTKKAVALPATLTKETVEDIAEDSFLNRVKILWLTGRWLKESVQDASLFELFQSTVGPLMDMVRVYTKVVDAVPVPVIEASFLTFLARVSSPDTQSVSPGYKKLLREANQKYGDKIVANLIVYGSSRDSSDLKFLNLLLGLR